MKKENYNYGIIGNCTSSALVSRECSIDWLCLPYFDSSSIFAKILDDKIGGHFKIVGENTTHTEQKYVPQTAIIKTIFYSPEGVFEVNDYMPRYIANSEKYHCPSEIQRNIRVISGKPKIRIELNARPNYAASGARYSNNKTHIKITAENGEYNSYFLYSNLDFKKVLSGELIELKEFSYFLLSYHEKLEEITTDKIYVDYEKTKTFWLDWTQKIRLPRNFRQEVIRSAITLKLLTFQKTGAVIAAPTTSLPEIIGEGRNWDYRFCWIRDASMTIELYTRIGHQNTAARFMSFILNMLPNKTENIRVMYSINGEKQLTEKTLPHLSGHKNSQPVRIGNHAYIQDQNDLYGELIEAIYTYFIINRSKDLQLTEEIWTVVRSLTKKVAQIWQTPDSGIWERREHLHHYVHSKMMNWVAIDRAAKIAKLLGKKMYLKHWSELADKIKKDILDNGWNEKLQAFSMYYGSDIYDASNLLMFHYGFLDRKDPRMISMVREYHKNLTQNNVTFRYIAEDEFGQPKNAFVVTTFWMINALYLVGEKEKAREMFDHINKQRNHLGLLSEAIEIASGRLTGNFPQGYSHLAHIQTILLMETDYDWSDVARMQRKLSSPL